MDVIVKNTALLRTFIARELLPARGEGVADDIQAQNHRRCRLPDPHKSLTHAQMRIGGGDKCIGRGSGHGGDSLSDIGRGHMHANLWRGTLCALPFRLSHSSEIACFA